MRALSSRVLWSVGLGAVLALNGCNCGRSPTVGGENTDPNNAGSSSSGSVGSSSSAAPILPPVGIARLEPNRGPTTGGTVLVVRGYNFTPTVRVTIGGAEASDVTVTDPQTLSLVTPPGTEGASDVVLTNSDGATTTFTGGFNYVVLGDDAPPAPSLVSVTPNTGPTSGGTVALLEGEHFQRGAIVVVGGRPARRVYFVSDTQITAVFPEGSIGTAKVAVTNPDGRSDLLLGAFAYYDATNAAPGPQLSRVIPGDGPVTGGQQTAVTGANFAEGVRAYLAGIPLELSGVAADGFTFVSPPGRRGLAPLMVTNPDGQSAVQDDAYNYFSPPPVVLGAQPPFAARAGGAPITIVGRWFQDGATVTIGGEALQNPAVADAETITGVVPPGNVGGPVDVTVTNPDGLAATLAQGFYYVDADNPPPEATVRVTRVSPSSGPNTGGINVIAFGVGFVDGATVTVGGAPATNIRVLGGTSISFRLPAGTVGAVDVEVRNPGQVAAVLRSGFIYFDPNSTAAAPTLTNVLPRVSRTSGGGTVALFGTGFDAMARVYFGTGESPRVRVASGLSLSAQVPAGTPGTVDVVVVNPDGKSGRLVGGFAYYENTTPDAAPVIMQLTPNRGGSAVFTAVNVVGTGFQPEAALFVDGVFTASVHRAEELVTAEFPPHAAGVVDVTITNVDGQSHVLTGGFTYEASPAPTVGTITPSTGTAGSTTVITINGTGFVPGTTLWVNGEQVPVTVISPTQLGATLPALPAGSVDITVRNPDGQSTTVTGGFTAVNEAGVSVAVTAVEPNSGPAGGGTRVGIRGIGLSTATGVTLGSAACVDLAVLSSTVIQCTAPAGPVGPVNVTVTLSDGSMVTRPNAWVFVSPNAGPWPSLASVVPAQGPMSGGTPIILSGTRLYAGTRVFVGGLEATSVTHVDDNTLTARTPAGRPENVDVMVVRQDGTNARAPGGFTYYDPASSPNAQPSPRIDGVMPVTVSTLGGTPAVLTGDFFRDGIMVLVDGRPAADVVRGSNSRVTFSAPAHAAGSAGVTVVNADGTFADLAGGLTYASQPPVITEISPSEGPRVGFTGVTIRGAGFSPGVQVLFGGVPSPDVIVLGPGLLLALTPAGTAGPTDVTVVNPDGTQATVMGAFTYFDGNYDDQAPVLEAITPARSVTAGGTMVSIRGRNLREGGRLVFGQVQAPQLDVISATEATVTTPAMSPQTVDVAWIAADGQVSVLRGAFTFSDNVGPAPQIGGAAPNRGPETGGTPTTIAGSRFRAGALVFFGRSLAPDTVVLNDAFINTRTPPRAPGVTSITVTNSDGVSTTLNNGYTYVASPVILGVSPSVLRQNTTGPVQIAGRNFAPGARVYFGTTQAAGVTVSGDSLVVATAPALPAGPVDVTVENPDGQRAILTLGFEYLSIPGLDEVLPGSAPSTAGSRVIINGDGFRSGLRVFFGGVEATDIAFVNDGVITVRLPAGTEGTQDVRVVNPDGQEIILTAGVTRVNINTLGAAPTLTGCLPDKGRVSGSTAVRLAGTNFAPGGWAFFAGVPAPAGFVDTTMVATRTPPGTPGPVTVELTNADGQTASRAGCFTYTDNLGADPAPIVATVQPGAGPTLGGSDIVVSGDHFRNGAALLIGNRLASSINVVSSTRIEARTPPGTVGLSDVTVSNTDGTTGTLPGGYRYLAPPLVLTVTPAEGPSVGGTTITIVGENFFTGAQVRIGGNLAGSSTVLTDRTITAITPAGTPGPAEVTVVNSDGQVGNLPAGFAYTSPPVVLGVLPASGTTRGDEFVTISGSGFRANARVLFGSIESPQVQVLAGNSIRARTPLSPAGRVSITVTNVDGFSDTLDDAFEFIPPPVLAGVSPNSGPEAGGTEVTLVGSGFRPGIAVEFGGVPAMSVTLVNATVLTATTPARPSGPAAVMIRNPDGQDTTLPNAFYYFPPIPPPRITAVSPNFGPITGGTIATITGDDFQFGARVFVAGTEVNAVDVAVLAQTQLRVRIPPGVATGAVPVRVLNPDGQDMISNGAWTYMPALALPPLGLSSVTPNRLTTAGNVLATVLGNGMATDVVFTVRKGSGPAIAVPIERYFSDVAVQVRLPAVGEGGLYDFRATVPSQGTNAQLVAIIEYNDVAISFTMNRGALPNDSRVADASTVVADFNNDGFKDIMFLRNNLRSVIYQNRGVAEPGAFDDVTSVNLVNEPDNRSGWHTFWNGLVADFNQDGFPDVVSQANLGWPYDGRWLQMWESEGFGRLRHGRGVGVSGAASGSAVVTDVVMGDIDNADGMDLLVCNGGAGSNGVDYWLQNLGIIRDAGGNPVLDANGRPQWKGFATRTFRAIVNGNPAIPAEDTRGCDLGDFDNDGDLDVVMGNAGNQANRLYVNDIATTGAIYRETIIDEFNTTTNNWSSNQLTGSISTGTYRAQLTGTSDPFIARGVTPFEPRNNRFQIRYKSYTNGPSTIRLYYTDSGADCSGWTDTCAESFPIIRDGTWNTLDVTVTDAEWTDDDGLINNIRLDFDGASALNTLEIDWLKFGGTFRQPDFIDASGSAQFNFGGDTRAARFVDFDNDSDLDIVMLNVNQDVFMAVNTVDGTGNRIFQNQPSRLCHNATCSLSNSQPPLLNQAVRVSVGADFYSRFGGSPAVPSDKWLDINQDGCTDLALWWSNTDGAPRYYVNKKVGSGASSCTGEFYYRDPADMDGANPLRNLYQASMNPQEQQTLFGRGIDTASGTRDHWVEMADFDNDGWLDMIQVPFPYSGRTGQQKRLYMRRPVTEGTETRMRFMDVTGYGSIPRNMQRGYRTEATDVNGDGAPDIIIMPAPNTNCAETDDQMRMRLWLNDGAGNFSDASNRIPHVRGNLRDISVADFNGDGKDDIAVLFTYEYCAGWNNQIRLYQNDGTGWFEDVTAAANMGSGISGQSTSGWYHLYGMTAVDVDNDGDKDLAFVGNRFYDRKLLINGGDPLGNGSPYFIDRSSRLPAFTGHQLLPLDYNADGKMDLYVVRDGNDYPGDAVNRLYENDGAGNYADVTLQSANHPAGSNMFAVAAPFVAVRQADGTLLGKPYPDIFVVQSGYNPAEGGRRRIFTSTLDTVANRVRLADVTDSNMRPGADGRSSRRARVVDWDRDGRADVVMPGHEDRPIYYNNVGNGVFEDRSNPVFPEHYMEATLDMAVADFDGDGDEDVFMCNYFQQHRILWNREIP